MSKPMTAAEYLASEEQSPYKREYVGGFVYPLHTEIGVSKSHSLISSNIMGTLHRQAIAKGCRLYQSNIKLLIQM